MNKKLNLLREKHRVFTYQSYHWDVFAGNLIIKFYFTISPDISFSPTLVIKDIPEDRLKALDPAVFDSLIFNLGLAEIASYWKCTCSPKILIKAGWLSSDQLVWWRRLLIDEMSQFYFENTIDFSAPDFVNLGLLPAQKTEARYSRAEVKTKSVMIPFSGGKDSIVTVELLKKIKIQSCLFMLNPNGTALKLVELTGVEDRVVVERKIDENLLKLNDEGYLNGHTPIMAYMSFLSILVAYIKGFSQILFSNERSAEEGNIVYMGKRINHQHDKTLEFENLFREYNQKYLSNIDYLSFLRPLYEIQITKIFSSYPKYLKVFKSCNVGIKTNSWCCQCAKCLSTFILLAPFLGIKETLSIFGGKNLLEDKTLSGLLESLTLEDRIKPFECVGTKKELKEALRMITEKSNSSPLLYNWGKNNLPLKYQTILKKALRNE